MTVSKDKTWRTLLTSKGEWTLDNMQHIIGGVRMMIKMTLRFTRGHFKSTNMFSKTWWKNKKGNSCLNGCWGKSYCIPLYLMVLFSNLCVVKQISVLWSFLFFFFNVFCIKARAEAADITVAAHRSRRAKQAGTKPGYLPYPLIGVGNTVINLLFSWRWENKQWWLRKEESHVSRKPTPNKLVSWNRHCW